MLSKNKIKIIRSLHTKKGRDTENCYLSEGDRIFKELIHSNSKIVEIIALPEWLSANKSVLHSIPYIEATNEALQSISTLTTAQSVICVVEIPNHKPDIENLSNQLILALDKIQDPGNMGTIIRLANWFGITQILCSSDCVDVYNPKVVQSAMGALCKTDLYSCDLETALETYKKNHTTPIYGAFLEGENIYEMKLTSQGVIVLGNEGNGISETIEKLITTKITIPSFNNNSVIESLNVSTAAAIICSEFRRQK